jgi:low temperature requirement protein LtrA
MKYYIFDKTSMTYKSVRHPVYTPNFLLTFGLVMLLIGIIMLALGTYLEQQRHQEPSEKELKVLIDRVYGLLNRIKC